ncbi:MAG: diguanylate cyclase [Leptolyngbya sp. RL_3_1]|nr:diguanylate cyclase [Leptolyngbya sp. RL_3_1]
MLRSIQTKFTLALLAVSLAASAVVGLTAQGLFMRQLNSILAKEAFDQFASDITAYYAAYGTWEAGQKTEPFDQFVRRGCWLIETTPTTTYSGVMPCPPLTQSSSAAPAPDTAAPDNLGRPDRVNSAPTPFQFVLLDLDGTVLIGAEQYQEGDVAPSEIWRQRQGITVADQVVAFAVPVRQPELAVVDQAYLQAVRTAIGYGLLWATGLAIALGLLLGRRLSRSLQELTRAVNAIGQGQLRQTVTVDTQDEVGLLATAFNAMSLEMASAYERMYTLNQTIQAQANTLKELSIRDELTNLHNRRYFNEHVAHLFSQGQRYDYPLTIMLADLDHFKTINDTFTHSVGDAVLREVAMILQNHTRDCDIVARYGGEEFVIALPKTSIQQAYPVGEKLRHRIEHYDWHRLHPDLTVTISMGLCDQMTLGSHERMLACADVRLYAAKTRQESDWLVA